jgi:hypothetical protein
VVVRQRKRLSRECECKVYDWVVISDSDNEEEGGDGRIGRKNTAREDN